MIRRLTEEEIRLWAKFTADIRRLSPSPLEGGGREGEQNPDTEAGGISLPLRKGKGDTPDLSHRKGPANVSAPAEDSFPQTPFSASPSSRLPEPLPLLLPGQFAGVDGGTAGRFRRGKLPLDGTLDLHGFTQDAAAGTFADYLAMAQNKGWRVIRIITGHGSGRGGGVLREALPRWINLPENRARILCFDAARPRDGGAGAYLLLLRKAKD